MSNHASDAGKAAPARRSIEWPTVILAIAIYGGFVGITWWWKSMPSILVAVAGGWLIAWQGSLQHEVMHGHPTRSQQINDAIGSIPLSLWLPYQIYKDSHLKHHRDEHLTDPIEDPESSYFTRNTWEQLGRFGRGLALWNTTLFGRLTIGPAVMILSFLAQEWPLVRANEAGRRRIWAGHLVGVSLLLIWVTVICGMPISLYFFGFVYIGAAMTRLRSYAEHRYAENHEERTAIVENSHFFGLLFLYNNLHVLHHRRPGISWYRLPRVYRQNRETLVRSNGGLVYNGYWEIARRFFFKPHDDPTHPRHS
ncbi:fatty acid desaturase [Agrobacterium larrymoorei]|uniref:Fatty acid desaturase n=1 Tax=Agrobacterium larrymoorei TaxID=160699 RepID=A0A4D7E0K4_9HYPH|nr:fatty acid desaturase [Agrobacterium larrymoorei]QCJ01048.1 fatty acid desaturase [Agrobacterium larrymoorei]QYA10385.1 fatty acid desaturase [Agrobacterium larrymoorei]